MALLNFYSFVIPVLLLPWASREANSHHFYSQVIINLAKSILFILEYFEYQRISSILLLSLRGPGECLRFHSKA